MANAPAFDSSKARPSSATVERQLAESGVDPREGLPLLAPLLGIELEGITRRPNSAPRRNDRGSFLCWSNTFLGSAKRQPLLLVLEDVH